MAGFNDSPLIKRLAVPAVCLLIAFLAYSSQILFYVAGDSLLPGRLSSAEFYTFNILLVCLWYTYYKACTVDPGRYTFADGVIEVPEPDEYGLLRRWCRKCSAPKPPRAHHCRNCRRCIPKMDHHCPWTANCVSMRTFPHFLRFLFYTNLSLWSLARLLFLRFASLWENRSLPSYLGPSLPVLVHLTLLSLVCFFTSFALFILFFSTIRSWVLNETMIEGWELDRHNALCDRSSNRNRSNGDFWSITGPDGKKLRLEKVEFPYDIGIFDNLSQAMGTRNVLIWFFPFAGNPEISKTGRGVGWDWPENGHNTKEGMWPPPDPEKMRRGNGGWPASRDTERSKTPKYASKEEELEAFKSRQEMDMRRWQGERSQLMAELEEADYDLISDESGDDYEQGADGEPGWTNADGERLQDYGVDEDEDMTDDEDIPLAELLRRRKVLQKDGEE
ncbi:palmitoyltransferase pfa4 [Colletotrichum truncatum]|uniref:Palmitoyltransferase pfa4 n=1 Tax=Colletotrichum truncatum TaxID=5467 RepID=A0ACC3YSY6_COLTU|nr:palmitoyltransferase pfa4 [Colletotrichum truncatum]KAF6785118.1 palmitoyltransferase pfa4 [Colletotrichum truncatum]